MSKRIVVYCDGTWNTPDQKDDGVVCPTNLTRLAMADSLRVTGSARVVTCLLSGPPWYCSACTSSTTRHSASVELGYRKGSRPMHISSTLNSWPQCPSPDVGIHDSRCVTDLPLS